MRFHRHGLIFHLRHTSFFSPEIIFRIPPAGRNYFPNPAGRPSLPNHAGRFFLLNVLTCLGHFLNVNFRTDIFRSAGFGKKNVFFCIVRRESLKKIRSENRRDSINSAGRRDSENNFGRPAGFGKWFRAKKTKCVSNERSGHDDENAYWIIKIGAILGYFWPRQSLMHSFRPVVFFGQGNTVDPATDKRSPLYQEKYTPKVKRRPKILKSSEKYRKFPEVSQRIRMHPNASDCIWTHPNASECIRMGPNGSKHLQKLQKTY